MLPGPSTFDSNDSLFFFIGANTSFNPVQPFIVGLDVASGQPFTSAPLPAFTEGGFVGVGQALAYCAASSRLVGIGQGPDGTHLVGFIEPESGAWELLASISSNYSVDPTTPAVCSDAAQAVLLVLGSPDGANQLIFAVDINTGAVSAVVEDFPDGHDLQTLAQDPVSGAIYGIGLVPAAGAQGSYNRTLAVLDPVHLNASIVGLVPGWLVSWGGFAAVDAASRSLLWVGQAAEGDPGVAPFALIATRLADASTAGATTIKCTVAAPTGCPNGLQSDT
jgi:hypothetical protein